MSEVPDSDISSSYGGVGNGRGDCTGDVGDDWGVGEGAARMGEEGWDDWGSDPEQSQPCVSLFDGSSLPSAAEVLKHDKEKHGFDLEGTCKRLSEFCCRKCVKLSKN